MKKILAGLMVLALTGGAHAERLYLGGAYGVETSLKISCANTSSCDVHDSGFKAYVGLNLTPQIAVEGAYLDFGSAGYRIGTTTHASGDAKALVANLAFRHAFIPEFSGVLRLGLAGVRSSGRITAPGGSVSVSENEFRPYYGLGVEYRFDKHWSGVLGADFTRGEVSDVKARLEMYSVGAQASF